MPVEVSPKDPSIKPCQLYADTLLHPLLLQALRAAGFERQTPCQQWAVPYLLTGKDMMVCSQTGSGKTLAYVLPLLHEILERPGAGGGGQARPIAVVLAPTRELAAQIGGEADRLLSQGGSCYARTACIYGGVPYKQSKEDLRRGADLLVATPGRLSDACDRGDVKLGSVRAVVLDEADRMLDLGFEPQIRELLSRRGMPPVGKRQTAMFSATFGVGVQHLAADFLGAYTFVAVGRVGSAAQTLRHSLMWVEDKAKPLALLGVLLCLEASLAPDDAVGVVVFVNTKDVAKRLEDQLRRWRFRVGSIHGDKQQAQRQRVLADFRRDLETSRRRMGRDPAGVPLLVATDVAARGLDIPDIGVVVQYDLPKRIDDFVHRSGRTGRLGRRGMSVAFANAQARGLSVDLVGVLAGAGAHVPAWLEGMAISMGADPRELQSAAVVAPAVQDMRLSGAGIQTAEERAEAQKLRTFDADAYAGA